MIWAVQFWPVLPIAFVGSLIATYICKRTALRFGIVDKPDDLVKTHKEPIAYLGGVGILVGLTVGLIAGVISVKDEECFKLVFKWLAGILAGGFVACCIGLVDDIYDISPSKKILGQIAAGAILIIVGVIPNLHFLNTHLNIPIHHTVELILESLIVIVFVVGATNSLNLLDGLDGLCAGVTAIITVAMLFLSLHLATWGSSQVGDPVRIIVCLGLVGGACGFLPFNKAPAKIFMGDAGSMLLGFIIAALMILFAEVTPRWWMASIVVFGLPILDTAVALARRLVNKRPLFVSDRGHIYDQMIECLGWSVRSNRSGNEPDTHKICRRCSYHGVYHIGSSHMEKRIPENGRSPRSCPWQGIKKTSFGKFNLFRTLYLVNHHWALISFIYHSPDNSTFLEIIVLN
jgi:UDP-GlcNAc:undecaprenyl-phosphate GlcNAc-1-phosphate transferase